MSVPLSVSMSVSVTTFTGVGVLRQSWFARSMAIHSDDILAMSNASRRHSFWRFCKLLGAANRKRWSPPFSAILVADNFEDNCRQPDRQPFKSVPTSIVIIVINVIIVICFLLFLFFLGKCLARQIINHQQINDLLNVNMASSLTTTRHHRPLKTMLDVSFKWQGNGETASIVIYKVGGQGVEG